MDPVTKTCKAVGESFRHSRARAPVSIHTVLLVMDVPPEIYSWAQMYFKKNHTGLFSRTHQTHHLPIPAALWLLEVLTL